MGTAQRDNLEFKKQYYKPPPNMYNPNIEGIKSKTASWGFGTSSRPNLNKTTVSPSPNLYDIPSKIQEGPKY